MLDLSRQARMVDINKINQYTFKIFGVGSIGSNVAKIMAKTGFTNIEVYDFDKVEEGNISAQAFDLKHIGKLKVDAIAEIIKESCGLEIDTYNVLIDEKFAIMPQNKVFYCCFFDSIEARELLYKKVKDFPALFLDARIGKFNVEHYFINCLNPDDKKLYEDNLKVNPSELQCGEKACIISNTYLSALIVSNIINYISGKDYLKIYLGNMEAIPSNYYLLGKPK